MPSTIVRVEILFFLICAAAIVGWKLLTGEINTRGLFDTKSGSGNSPARMQMLLATLAGAGWYLGLVISNTDPTRLPDVPDALLLLLGGSHLTYLGAKGADQLGWFTSLFSASKDS
jgi:hypothetical protein